MRLRSHRVSVTGDRALALAVCECGWLHTDTLSGCHAAALDHQASEAIASVPASWRGRADDV